MILELKNLSKIYQTNKIKSSALKNINLSFVAPEFVSIVGPSGCGKTTLLNIIGGLDQATSGEMLVYEESTKDWNTHQFDIYRNQMIGFVFQNYELISHLTVYENIALSCKLSGDTHKEIQVKVEEALEKVGLLSKRNRRPKELSGGEKQRVSIARAIVNHPKILLADEPTGALDTVNSKEIMEILKKLSQDSLVIMVTHNEPLANTYSDRIVSLLDGEIHDIQTIHKSDLRQEEKEQKRKIFLPWKEAFLLAIRNLWMKRFRSLLIILSSSIGLIAVGLIFSLSSGVDVYLQEAQTKSMLNYPITVYSSAAGKSNNNSPITENYPDSEIVHIRIGETENTNLSYMNEDAIDYIENMNSEWTTAINYNRGVSAKLITKYKEDSYKSVSSYLYEMSDNQDYIQSQYDCLYGHFPDNKNEAVLLLDSYNAISAYTLDALGIDYSGKESFTFQDFLGIEYRYCSNSDWYQYDEEQGYYIDNYHSLKEAYLDSREALKIVGIIRVKKNSTLSFYTNPGILYTKSFTDFVLEDSLSSPIVKSQIEWGLSKNVTTGNAYEDIITASYTLRASYQYQSKLANLGAIARVYNVKIYTKDYDTRRLAREYLQDYIQKNTQDTDTFILTIYDFLGSEAEEISSFFKLIKEVLFIFACVSILVSSILIAIITYISVMERTKEIGILRSIGARKKDVSRIFHTENIVLGFFSGVLAIIGVAVFIKPINSHINTIIATYGYDFMLSSQVKVAIFHPLYSMLLLILGMLLSFIAGSIPAIYASHRNPAEVIRG